MAKGTFRPNRRPVVATAPDMIVFINGEPNLPSGANPNRRIPIQPLINSVSINLSVNSAPGSATIDLHVPTHYLDDIYIGKQLTLTTMMEVQIYMKGHFTVGGVPQYYPVFWGITTSVSDSWSAGEQTVSLACLDILYWWQLSQININPSWMAANMDHTQRMNFEGNYFTGVTPFSVIYTLSRSVHGDSMNVRNQAFQNFQERSEAPPEQNRALMAYWSLRWGRIGSSLKMFGPTGQVLKGDLLQFAINPKKFLGNKAGLAAAKASRIYDAFAQGDFNFAEVSAFSLVLSKLGNIDLWNSEFESKLNLATQTKETIGYEFFMDVTGEIIFKPPFYNLDVRPNFPVSWIRDIDVISSNYAENPPDATFIEGTGLYFKGTQVGMGEQTSPKATYVDYRLVQKYGWIPGSFSSEFIGSTEEGGPKGLFYHLVDVLDRQNARVNNGSITIPLRPELRLGYPVYVEEKDAYYYVEGITHTFSYGGRCTTQLTLMARRQKFYGAFGAWDNEGREPRPGEFADPGLVPQNLYKRDIDPTSGTPVGDRNVNLTYVSDFDPKEVYGDVAAFDEAADSPDAVILQRNLVNLRSQFGIQGANKYLYQVDEDRDVGFQRDAQTGAPIRGPLTVIEANPVVDQDEKGRTTEVNAATFPVSDERGYEVVGAYEYGRRAMISAQGVTFDKAETEVQTEGLLFLDPSNPRGGSTVPNVARRVADAPANAYATDPSKDKNFLINPNNYGRNMVSVRPPDIAAVDLSAAARALGDASADTKIRQTKTPTTAAGGPTASVVPDNTSSYSLRDPGISLSGGGRSFRYNSNVARWRGTIRSVRADLGVSEEDLPDYVLLGFIHTESSGKDDAWRTNKNGKKSQFKGLLQQYDARAASAKNPETGEKYTSDEFLGRGDLAIQHFIQDMKQSEEREGLHGWDPKKMSISWKGGNGTLREYNRREARGDTQQELDAYLASKFGTDKYVDKQAAAQGVWEAAMVPADEVENPEFIFTLEEVQEAEGFTQEELETEQGMVFTEEEVSGDEAQDPVLSNLVNVVGLPDEGLETETQVSLFGEALSANLAQSIYALPANIQPPRDRSVLPILNSWLREIYQRCFAETGVREAEYRGLTRAVTGFPDNRSIPTEPPDQRTFVDTPLSRTDVQEALDNGQTREGLFREGGEVFELERSFEAFEQARANLNEDDDG